MHKLMMDFVNNSSNR